MAGYWRPTSKVIAWPLLSASSSSVMRETSVTSAATGNRVALHDGPKPSETGIQNQSFLL